MCGPNDDPDALTQEEEDAIIEEIDAIYQEPEYRGDKCEDL